MESHNWVTQFGFVCAVVVALASAAICIYKKGIAGLTWSAPVLDMLRGAAMFPLALFAYSPMDSTLGSIVIHEEPLIVALGAAGGFFALISDWWRNI
jgi:hypothetical protein